MRVSVRGDGWHGACNTWEQRRAGGAFYTRADVNPYGWVVPAGAVWRIMSVTTDRAGTVSVSGLRRLLDGELTGAAARLSREGRSEDLISGVNVARWLVLGLLDRLDGRPSATLYEEEKRDD